METFSDITGLTSLDIYKNTNNYASFVKQYTDNYRLGLIDDRDKLLHMRACLQVSGDVNILQQFINLTNNNSVRAVRIGPMYTNNIQDVEKRIREEVQNTCQQLRNSTKNPNAMVEGNIYVIIMQAPYYKAADGSMMSVQFNISDYGMLPVGIATNEPIQNVRNTMLDYEAFVIFSKYKKDLTLRNAPYDVDVEFGQYRSKHEQCFIKCMGDGKYVCGCKTGDVPQQHYMSKCVTSKMNATSIEDKNKAVPHNFPIIYLVNRKDTDVMPFVSQAI